MLDNLAADRTRVAELEAQILHLEQALHALQDEQPLRSLKDERDLAQQRLDSYHYPVLDLPLEITCEIFLQFLPVYPLSPPLTGLNSPTLLTRICRTWRIIALSTPTLWRAMSLTSTQDISIERQLQIFDLWLKRSGRCRLSIAIDDDAHARALRAEVVP
ncbi:hypothetical protein C8R46DRAFT_1125536 [Mycena filopes]|nr:hypothetical protein C8R46DRAFT_1125536 [Mycena filopes]